MESKDKSQSFRAEENLSCDTTLCYALDSVTKIQDNFDEVNKFGWSRQNWNV